MPQYESVSDVFTAMADEYDPDAVDDMDAVLQFDIAGDGGGLWSITIKDRQVVVNDGATADATTTLRMSEQDFLNLVNGELNPVSAFMQGLIKIDGDMSVAMQLQKLLGS